MPRSRSADVTVLTDMTAANCATDVTSAISDAFLFCQNSGVELPEDLLLDIHALGCAKQADSLMAINATYHDQITRALLDFFTSGRPITAPQNSFRRATVEAFASAFELGWTDGGGNLPVDQDANTWLQGRIELEFGYIALLFQQAKDLRSESGFDYFSWATERADGYTATLRELYNTGKARASKDVMVTFLGEDGAESCITCQTLKGKRHRISWFVSRNYIPPRGVGLECHPGGRCQHGLVKDNGDWITE